MGVFRSKGKQDEGQVQAAGEPFDPAKSAATQIVPPAFAGGAVTAWSSSGTTSSETSSTETPEGETTDADTSDADADEVTAAVRAWFSKRDGADESDAG